MFRIEGDNFPFYSGRGMGVGQSPNLSVVVPQLRGGGAGLCFVLYIFIVDVNFDELFFILHFVTSVHRDGPGKKCYNPSQHFDIAKSTHCCNGEDVSSVPRFWEPPGEAGCARNIPLAYSESVGPQSLQGLFESSGVGPCVEGCIS